MPALFVDLLPPEYQHLWSALAAGVALLGLLLWAVGIKTGRILSALALGAVGAGAGAWVAAAATDFSPYTGAIAGLAVGVLLGALAYRLLLAIAFALAISGLYLGWQANLNGAAATQPEAATLPASDLEISLHTTTQAATTPTSRPAALGDLLHALRRQWDLLPHVEQTRVTVIAGASWVAAFIFCLLMFRRAAMFLTAFLGSLLLFVGITAILNVYARPAAAFIPAAPLYRYGLLGLLTLLGTAIQWRFFTPYIPPPRPPKEPAPAASAK